LKGGLWNRGGSGDVVELGWRLGFSFEGKLAWGCVEEAHLYMGVGRSLKGLRFELEIKSEIS
jgi:hypothetical protein